MRVQTWLTGGWSPEIITAAVRGVVARQKTGDPPASVQFFEKAIAEEIARQAAPLPQIALTQAFESTVKHHGKTNSIIAAADSLIQLTHKLGNPQYPGDEPGSATSAVDVGLLPQR